MCVIPATLPGESVAQCSETFAEGQLPTELARQLRDAGSNRPKIAQGGNTAGVWMVDGAFISLLEKNRNLWLKPDCRAQVCPSYWRLAALGLSSTEFTVAGRNSLVVHGEHVLGECYSQFGAEASALAILVKWD